MIGSMKYASELPETPLAPTGASDAHILQIIKLGTQLLPKDAAFAAQRALLSETKEEY